jgi:hypothetical protein
MDSLMSRSGVHTAMIPLLHHHWAHKQASASIQYPPYEQKVDGDRQAFLT